MLCARASHSRSWGPGVQQARSWVQPFTPASPALVAPLAVHRRQPNACLPAALQGRKPGSHCERRTPAPGPQTSTLRCSLQAWLPSPPAGHPTPAVWPPACSSLPFPFLGPHALGLGPRALLPTLACLLTPRNALLPPPPAPAAAFFSLRLVRRRNWISSSRPTCRWWGGSRGGGGARMPGACGPRAGPWRLTGCAECTLRRPRARTRRCRTAEESLQVVPRQW